MKKNNDGFIAMSVIYSIFVLFIMIMITTMLSYVSSRRNTNRIKEDIRNQFANGGPTISFSKNGSEDNHIMYHVGVEVNKTKYDLSSAHYMWSQTADGTGNFIPVGVNAEFARFSMDSPQVPNGQDEADYYLIVKACDVQLNCTIAISKKFHVTKDEVPTAKLESGIFINNKMRQLSGQTGDTNTAIKSFSRYVTAVPSDVNMREANRISTTDSPYPVYMWYVPSTGYIMWYSEADLLELNEDSSQFFWGLTKLQTVDLRFFRTDNVMNFSGFFYNNQSLISLDLSNFNTANATDMSYMFSNLYTITRLDTRSFNTNYVTDMNHMFDSCINLDTWLRTGSTFTTAKVTNMSYMFYNDDKLTSLNFNGFNTSKVTNMESMFESMDALTTIKVGDYFKTDLVTNSANMFRDCTNLVGGNGTRYTSSKVDKTYARKDTSSTPGYFTPQ